jgi:Tol biopolymer transport system component
VQNQGLVPSNDFNNGFYLSHDPTITATDRELAVNSNLGLASWASFTWGGPTLRLPAELLPGNYFIGILVDRSNTTPEACEDNNYVSAPVTVQGILYVLDGQIHRVNPDGSGIVRLTSGSWAADPASSPDGSKIAFTRQDARGAHQLHIMNADGSGIVQLTNITYAREPSWSPDGSRIAFTGSRAPYIVNGDEEIYVINTDQSGPVYLMSAGRLTNNTSADEHPAWSPDGSKIAFTSSRSGDWADIYVMNTDGTGQVNVTRGGHIESHPAWSPDGSKIAFTKYENGTQHLYVMSKDGSGPVNLTPNRMWSREPAWSQDGSRIAFVTKNEQLQGAIYVMNSDGSGQVNVTPSAWQSFSDPAWSPGRIGCTSCGTIPR